MSKERFIFQMELERIHREYQDKIMSLTKTIAIQAKIILELLEEKDKRRFAFSKNLGTRIYDSRDARIYHLCDDKNCWSQHIHDKQIDAFTFACRDYKESKK